MHTEYSDIKGTIKQNNVQYIDVINATVMFDELRPYHVVSGS